MNRILFRIAQWKLLLPPDMCLFIALCTIPIGIIGLLLGAIVIGVKVLNGVTLYGLAFYAALPILGLAAIVSLVALVFDWVTDKIVDYIAWKE